MAFDTWDNIGYKVIDTLDSYGVMLADIKNDLVELKGRQAGLETKMWVIGTIAALVIGVIGKVVGLG